MLLSCSLSVWESGDTWLVGDETHYALHVKLTGPRAAYEVLRNNRDPITQSIRHALDVILPGDAYVKPLTAHTELVDIDPDWRAELLEIARGKGVHNQAVEAVSARI